MAKTIQVAADRAYDTTKTVLPVEVARGIYIENPPSAQALKLMHLLIAKAGGRMADETQHEMRMSDLKHIEGMRNHDRASLRALFTQLRAAVMVYDDTEAQEEVIGGFMDEIRLDYRQEAADTLVVKWWFGRTFRRIAAESNHWAILDRQTVFALSSKYSILLFQNIASLANLDRIDSKSFTVPELRALFGVEGDRLGRFADFNRWALKPAIAEINQLSRLKLKATPRKTGRTVTSVEISWAVKMDPTEAKREVARHSTGRKKRRNGTMEQPPATFPETGGIAYSPRWLELKREAGCNMDNALIATDFRRFLKERGIARDARNIEKLFRDYCRKVGTV
ncbi:MAG: replication initiation protein [Jhaorihella sp.]